VANLLALGCGQQQQQQPLQQQRLAQAPLAGVAPMQGQQVGQQVIVGQAPQGVQQAQPGQPVVAQAAVAVPQTAAQPQTQHVTVISRQMSPGQLTPQQQALLIRERQLQQMVQNPQLRQQVNTGAFQQNNTPLTISFTLYRIECPGEVS